MRWFLAILLLAGSGLQYDTGHRQGQHMMRVLLISGNREVSGVMTPLPLGLACVAAATAKAGFKVSFLDLLTTPDWESATQNAIIALQPDVIGLSVRNIDDQTMLNTRFLLRPLKDLIALCRRICSAPIVLGGAGFSIFPESTLAYLGADMGIQGEGETAFPSLLSWLEKGSLGSPPAGVYLSEPIRTRLPMAITADLDSLPLPAPEAWLISGMSSEWRIPVQTRRGCARDCAFCSTGMIEGRQLRWRSAEAVVNWLASYRERGYRNFTSVDNTFNVPPAYAKELCRKMIDAKLDIDWWGQVYPKWIDRELVDLMAQAGCTQVNLGFESGSEPVLRLLNKQFKPAEVAEISAMFAAAGVKRNGFLMLGAPGETRQTVEESLAFAKSLHLDGLKISVGIRIYPYTALAARAVSEGIIAPEDDLLFPRFYLAPALRDWLPGCIASYNSP
jgi:radical SAM superfamily enzyme YgiQ (UPF0313 family)